MGNQLLVSVPEKREVGKLYLYKVAHGKWEVGVNRRNGKCVTNH